MGGDLVGEWSQLGDPLERGREQGRIVAVGSGRDQMEGDPRLIDGGRTLEALLPPIHWGAAGFLAPAWRFGQTTIDGEIRQLQPDEPVVLLQHLAVQQLGQSGLRPLVNAPANGAIRAACRGDPLVARAVDQGGHDVLEDQPIRDAAAMAA
jgi:hypothetical protein